jgi:hypothetical protein
MENFSTVSKALLILLLGTTVLLAGIGTAFSQADCGPCGFPGVVAPLKAIKIPGPSDIQFVWNQDPSSVDGYRVYKIQNKPEIPLDNFASYLTPACTDDNLGPQYSCILLGGVPDTPLLAFFQVVGVCQGTESPIFQTFLVNRGAKVEPDPASGTDISVPVSVVLQSRYVLGAVSWTVNFDHTVATLTRVDPGTTPEFSGSLTCNIDNINDKATCATFNVSSMTSPTGCVHFATMQFSVVGQPASSSNISISQMELDDINAILIKGVAIANSSVTVAP